MTDAKAALAALAFFCLNSAQAGPADYVYTPIVEEGEREIDFKAGSWSERKEPGLGAASLGLGWGVNSRWFTEFYVKGERPGGEGTRFDAFEWENRFQLTETGKYWLDAGVVLEIERPRNHAEGWEFRFGPLLQKEIDRVQLNANFLFERHVRAAEAGDTTFGYQAQAKYRWQRELEFGVQALGELGPWQHWSSSTEQSHRVGPAIFGKLRTGDHQAISYNAAVLWGLTDSSPRHNARVQVEYEF